MHWFENQLEIAPASDSVDLAPVAARLSEASYKKKVVSILNAVDLPISDIRVSEASAPPTVAGPDTAPTVEFLYDRDGQTPMWIDSAQDSSGAQRLMSLLSPLLDGIEKDCFVAIDEFDTHLHPFVARFLVQMINNDAFTHRHVQVLLVSHTTSLMDLDILRRDELWLVELDRHHASRLKSMARYSLRKREIVARAYLKGKYGAIPKVEADVFENLLAENPPAGPR
jgi:predicted ATPase